MDFHGKLHLSSALICKYISKYKHSLQKLNLQECYWLKGSALSTALQKCRKLKSLNVLGCSVSKKTLCSVLKLNSNLTTWHGLSLLVICTSLPPQFQEKLSEIYWHLSVGTCNWFYRFGSPDDSVSTAC